MVETCNCVTVRTLLDNGCLCNAVVVSGYGGLDREVRDITVISVPDPGVWLRGKELLLTTGYPFRNDPEALSRNLKVFIERDSAALAFKEGRYMPPLTDEVLNLSEKSSFPIIRLGKEVRWVDIIGPFYNLLVSRERTQRPRWYSCGEESVASFFSQVLSDEDRSPANELMDSEGNRPKIHPYYGVLVVRVANLHFAVSVLKYLRTVLSSLGPGIILVPKEQDIVIIWPASQQSLPILERARYVANALVSKGFGQVLPVSTVSRLVSIDEIAKAYRQAKTALDMKGLVDEGEAVIRYEDLELFGLLLSAKQDSLHEFCTSKIGKLIEYDKKYDTCLIQTLTTYLERNCSLNRAAEALFVHPNTIKYRLHRIEELLGSECLEFTRRTELYVALKLHRLLSAGRARNGTDGLRA